MGKLVPLNPQQRQRNRDFNQGYDDAWEDTGCDVARYENSTGYRRGYDAGEADRDELSVSGDYDEPTPDQMKAIYGDPKDRL